MREFHLLDLLKIWRSYKSLASVNCRYASGHGGSVEHWKKLARKAELEMHLEQEQHKSDREKDLDSIHRLRCRLTSYFHIMHIGWRALNYLLL